MPAGHNATTTIAAAHQAAEANRRTPGRRGNVVEIPAGGGDVLVSGDLHGDRRNFEAVLAHAALDDHPRRHLVMQEVCHGGPSYPDAAGCMSHLMLEDVIGLKVRYPDRFHFLMSNHELAELTDYPIVKGQRLLNLQFRCGMQSMYDDQTEAVRAGYLEFLASCPLAIRVGAGVFLTHSLPAALDCHEFDATIFDRELTPDDVVTGGSVFRLVWGRDYRRDNAAAFASIVHAQVLIHGHDPCVDGFRAPNDLQLIIDGQGDKAAYVLLPLDRNQTHEEIVQSVRRVNG